MSSLNKVLIGVAVLLILLTVAEVGYYFFQLSAKQPKPQTALKTNLPSDQPPIPTQSIRISRRKEFISNKTLASQRITSVFQGTLVGINTQDEMSAGKKYRAKIELRGERDTNTLYLGNYEYNLAKIFKKVGDKTAPIQFTDLKAGDVITINWVIDTTTETAYRNTKSIIITVI